MTKKYRHYAACKNFFSYSTVKLPGLIAEGVETRDQVELLKRMGCDQVQGYYYAKPMPPEDFRRLLLEDRRRAAFFS